MSGPPPEWNRLTFVPASTQPVVLEELGFLEQPPPSGAPSLRFYARYVAAAVFAVCALLVIAAWRVPPVLADAAGPWLFALFCFCVCVLEVWITFSPYWSRDLRSVFAAELIRSAPGGNLTGGLYEGARIVQGLGQTLPGGTIQWHRMPGYGWFCALAASVARSTDVVDIAMAVVVLQVVLYSAAVGIFVASARHVFSAWMTALLGGLLVLAPKQVASPQVDSVIGAIAILVLSALLVDLAQPADRRRMALATFLLVNLAFALWFVARNDVVPGWIAVAVVLARRRWRYLLIPVVLAVAIALPWALYKRQYTHRLDLLPTNTGEVLFLSLCEAPGAFPYECTDTGYFEWAARFDNGDPTSSAASTEAAAEVVRHWITYPVHFAFMVWFKFRRCIYDSAWPGLVTPFNRPFEWFRATRMFIVLTAVLSAAVVVDHQRRRSFLLGWVVFLNMPLFFIVYASGGRFYPAAGISLIVAAVPLLFERGLYVQMARYPWRVAVIAAGVVAVLAGGGPMERWIEANDSIHYWAPLRDPARSTLQFVGRR